MFIFVSEKQNTLQTMDYEYDFWKTELIDRQIDKISNGECNNLCLNQLKQRQRQRKDEDKDKNKDK